MAILCGQLLITLNTWECINIFSYRFSFNPFLVFITNNGVPYILNINKQWFINVNRSSDICTASSIQPIFTNCCSILEPFPLLISLGPSNSKYIHKNS